MKNSIKTKFFVTFLILTFFALSFFSRYQTVSKYDIVSGMSIDEKNGVYTIVCEVSMPSSNNDFGSKVEYVKGTGFTVESALDNANLKSTNRLYFDSVQLYVISHTAFEKNDIKNYFKSDYINYRAVAVLSEGDASNVLYSEKDSTSRAKSLSLSQKLKSFCNEQKLSRPSVITLLKSGGEIYINRDGLMQKGGLI